MRVRWLLAGLIAVAVGCGSSPPKSPAAPPGTDLRTVALTAAQLRDLAAADRAFGDALTHRLLTGEDGNVVLSPASIATALQMAYVGAHGRTATEMAAAMHLAGLTPTQVAAAAARLLAGLAPLSHDRRTLLAVANEVWVQSGFPLTSSYDAMMRTGFGAGMQRADFRRHAEDARRAINAAVAAATRDKIRDLIPSGQIDELTRLVLTNAVYLKAQWAQPFQPAATANRPFRRADGSTVTVPMMTMTDDLGYAHGPGYQAVQLPYVGGRLAMTLVLPTTPGAAYPAHLGSFGDRFVDLWLPKFRFTWERELTPALRDLGMTQAFADDADFTGISTAEPLHVAFVRHKAFIAVDEKGTEAAAATAVGMGTTSAPAGPPVVLHLDRPFFFTITDTATGLPLFLGRVADPTLGR